jgi:hypothetical protein
MNEKEISEFINQTNAIQDNLSNPKLLTKGDIVKRPTHKRNKIPNLERKWEVVEINSKIKLKSMQILTKTRNKNSITTCDEKMYSSIKYEINQKINLETEIPFIYGRISVIDYSNGNKLYEVSGESEINLKKNNDGYYEGRNKIQHNNISAHFKNTELLCWELRYYDPKHLTIPILIIRSPPFLGKKTKIYNVVFARRPTKKIEKKNKKRKANNYYDELSIILDDINHLNEHDKYFAIQLTLDELGLRSLLNFHLKEIQNIYQSPLFKSGNQLK